ncbi:four helix bundle protein [bacterium]|nr:four helix bundle protein [bacterium]
MIKQKKYDLRERLLALAKRIIQISGMLPNTPECYVIRKQIVASGTSIGANFEEADVSVSKKDFIHKVSISLKEANETRYWLEIIADTYLNRENIVKDINEITEILKILSTIIKNSNKS